MARVFSAVPANDLPPVPDYNICPTRQIHAVCRTHGQRRLVSMRWGFVARWYRSPGDGPLLINARAETLADKPAFAEAGRSRRCLIPASGFYEWSVGAGGRKLPWYLSRRDARPLALAGIWQDWEPRPAARDARSAAGQAAAAGAGAGAGAGTGAGERLTSCAIVTTRATPDISHIHHRMPVIIEEADMGLWLGERGKGAAKLLRPPHSGLLAFHRVGTKVNSSRATGEALIAPLDDSRRPG